MLKRKLRTNNGCVQLTIPKQLCDLLDLNSNDTVTFKIMGTQLVLEKYA